MKSDIVTSDRWRMTVTQVRSTSCTNTADTTDKSLWTAGDKVFERIQLRWILDGDGWSDSWKGGKGRPLGNQTSLCLAFISRPRVARAGTNKLKCQKNIPTGSHLTQMSAGVPNLNATLNLNNFGQNGQNWKIFVPIIKPASWGFWGKKSFFDFDLFWPRSGQNCEPTLKFASK